MPGKGKGQKKGARAYTPKNPKGTSTKSHRAGLQFPVGRARRHLKNTRLFPRIGESAPVYMAAVLEYIAGEVLEKAGNEAKEKKKRRITSRHIGLAVRDDEEIDTLLKKVTVAAGGVVPHIQKELLQK